MAEKSQQLQQLTEQAEKALRSCYFAPTPSSSERQPLRSPAGCSRSPEISQLAATVKGFRRHLTDQPL
jgi:hypothetical protein